MRVVFWRINFYLLFRMTLSYMPHLPTPELKFFADLSVDVDKPIEVGQTLHGNGESFLFWAVLQQAMGGLHACCLAAQIFSSL